MPINRILDWAIENDVKIELLNSKGRYALVISKGEIKSTFSIDQGIGFDLAQHLLYPAIESIRHKSNKDSLQHHHQDQLNDHDRR
ncbi:hypothetical protein LCGC14_0646470 [marine sediment metagenome]|uniref:Uncharacterized protein n=1 Tax=marine sediment metagenome TaxID=412755 RepID=A0A0F9RH67_9ZZZZ